MGDDLMVSPDSEPVVECEAPGTCDLPAEFIDMAFRQWQRFKADPGDFRKFLDCDLVMKAAIEKWHAYSWPRMVVAR